MSDPHVVLLYVDDLAASTAFYVDVLGKEPAQARPGYTMFMLPNGLRLALWARDTVEPAAVVTGGGTELGFPVDADASVDSTCADWKARGIAIAQEPTDMNFGRTFVALDPDGHRLRVLAPRAA